MDDPHHDNTEAEAENEIAEDFRLLDEVENGAAAVFRTWHCTHLAVVLGLSQKADTEVHTSLCREQGIPILKRASGGGAVVLGPGTLQYAFALPYKLSPELSDINGAKLYCNRLLIDALPATPGLSCDDSGDLTVHQRKVSGVALRRRRNAMLLHGTLLINADLELIDRILKHPSREPEYRGHRRHRDFIANFGDVCERDLAASISQALTVI